MKTQKKPQVKQPGKEHEMKEKPQYKGTSGPHPKLKDRVAIITGGDSGIGRAVAVAFAKEGANILIAYLDETKDAKKTKKEVEEYGVKCKLIKGDVSAEDHCKKVVEQALDNFGQIDILVNNAAMQFPQKSILDISDKQLKKTFATNIFSHFYLVKAALPFLKEGSSIINTASVTAYHGSPQLLDYSATKGAIVAFTRSLSISLSEKKIRVNAVAPGPIWTPLIPATFNKEKVKNFGKDTPMGRPGQPEEVAGCYVFLASDDASYISGQVLHPNGGTIVNG
ncbi:NAD(P)-dependent oxidoreductase [Pelobium manganitolerans]|uniref:NAD(P)-dependent oxidoreductase n=1 Tax=Pelobium manganitolerans TaxID=1842495 RepID=A0A419SB62_9SPHI|nr:SDR family oxidoreductase [Pelobium manganitolerans]RKD19542.1 NAD(P)-dependent oxidoreductase [Pelobium manganitolerans]